MSGHTPVSRQQWSGRDQHETNRADEGWGSDADIKSVCVDDKKIRAASAADDGWGNASNQWPSCVDEDDKIRAARAADEGWGSAAERKSVRDNDKKIQAADYQRRNCTKAKR